MTFWGLLSGAAKPSRGGAAVLVPRCQSGKGGVNMGDSIGTNREGSWLERVEKALYTELLETIEAGNYLEADKWVDLLERLSIV